jgi:hypothetical protein
VTCAEDGLAAQDGRGGTVEAHAPDGKETAVGDWGEAPTSPWDEVAEGLWMGGSMEPPRDAFDMVVTLDSSVARAASLTPDPRTLHLVWGIYDAGLPDLGRLEAVARFVGDVLDTGARVLVRCTAGMNRSGLVCATVLCHQGLAGPQAVARIRRRRHPDALSNPAFHTHLSAGRVRAPDLAAAACADSTVEDHSHDGADREPGRDGQR